MAPSLGAVPQACAQVLGICELFTAVLRNLDMKSLLRCQYVHSYFKDTITQSPSLQQKLFMLPAPGDHEPELNEMVSALLPPLFDLQNPGTRRNVRDLHEIYDLDWFKNPGRRERVLRPEASWRRMFPVQPPAELEPIQIMCQNPCFQNEEFTGEVCLGKEHKHLLEGGITSGLLLDIVAKFQELHPDPCFSLHWRMFPAPIPRGKQNVVPAPLVRTVRMYHKTFVTDVNWRPRPSLLAADTPFLLKVREDACPESMLEWLVTDQWYLELFVEDGAQYWGGSAWEEYSVAVLVDEISRDPI